MVRFALIAVALLYAPVSAEARHCPKGKIHWRATGECVSKYKRSYAKRVVVKKREARRVVMPPVVVREVRVVRWVGPLPTWTAFPPEKETFYGEIVTPIWGSFAYQFNTWLNPQMEKLRYGDL